MFYRVKSGFMTITTLLVFFASVSSAQAFNCKRAGLAAERVICATPALYRMDRQLNSSYRFARSKISASQKRKLKKSQRKWLKSRNKCRTNAHCIGTHYKKWFAEFNKHKKKFTSQ